MRFHIVLLRQSNRASLGRTLDACMVAGRLDDEVGTSESLTELLARARAN
jgi:hypothetical protein